MLPIYRKVLFSAGVALLFTVYACDSGSGLSGERTQFASPLDSLNALLESGDYSVENYTARSRIYLMQNDLAAAKNDVDSAFALDQQRPEVLSVRGDVYYRLNSTRVARDSWLAVAEMDPNDIDSRSRLAELFLAVRDYLKALKYVNEVLNLNSRQAEALFLKGYIYLELEDTTNAVKFVEQAIDARPDYFEAFDLLGVISAVRNDNRAIDYYTRAAEIQPGNSMVYYKLGLFFQERAEWNRAIESYYKAVELDPKNAFAHFNLGYIHTELDLFEQARDHFTNAIQANDRYYQAYYGRGYCFESLGQLDRAKTDYETALNVNNEYDAAKSGLGRVSKILRETGS